MKTFTMAQAAKHLGISRQTLYSWIDAGKVAAPKPTVIGRQSFRLWTEADIDRARRFKGSLKPGPRTRSKKKK
jgi:excisionase family DNA binding protein